MTDTSLRIANKEEESVRPLAGLRSNADRLVFVLTLVLIFLAAARTPIDTDLWWHLRAGETTWAEGAPLLRDTLSFTRAGESWTNHSWLSQVGMFLLYRLGGYLALGATVAFLAAGMMALVYFQSEGPALLRAFLLVLASAVAAVVWTPRPQTISLFLFALTGWILYQYKWRQRDYLWWLVPLFVLWSNLHGGYALGLLAIGAAGAGEILNHILGARETALPWRRIARLALMGVMCALVVAINPNGVRAWLIPFQTVSVGVLQNFVSEWASPDFHDLVQQPLLWMIFLLLASLGLSKRRIDGGDLAAVVVFGMMAFIARRNYGPFALVAAPVISRHLWPVLRSIRLPVWAQTPHGQEGESAPRFKRVVNLLLVLLVGFAAIGKLYVVTHPAFVDGQVAVAYPARAVAWMDAENLKGRVFNEYAWGGYLGWAQSNPIFVDGRTDLFGDDIITQWMTVVQAGEGWQAVLALWQVDWILLEPQRPVVAQLSASGWHEVYRDEISVLFGRAEGYP